MLPIGEYMSRWRFIWLKRENKENPVGKSNPDTILDTCQCEVNFECAEVLELTDNVIVEEMYAQCDENDNKKNVLD